jgi:hypothetical protein
MGYKTVQLTRDINLETTKTPNWSKLGSNYVVYKVHMDNTHPSNVKINRI